MRLAKMSFCAWLLFLCLIPVFAEETGKKSLSDYFPPGEDKGGWRSLLPETGEPDADQKKKIHQTTGIDWDKLSDAWKHNTSAPGATGLLVISKGHIVGEWYRDCDRNKAFNIYSSSKSYLSTAFGLILEDFGHGPLPSGRKLTLDTKVCNQEWIPESVPLSDPKKSDITLRHLLNICHSSWSSASSRWLRG